MSFEVPVSSEGFADMARAPIFRVQLNGLVVQDILCVSQLSAKELKEKRLELTRIEEHVPDCGSFLVKLEGMPRQNDALSIYPGRIRAA